MAVEVGQNPGVAEDERIALRLSKELKERAERLADQDGRSLSNWIKRAMIEKADRDEASGRTEAER